MRHFIFSCIFLLTLSAIVYSHKNYSGIYPHLAFFNQENECGTGAVVPWAGRLWVITYGPHLPNGSSDKLYEITPELQQIVRPESIGGTPANRLIHRESNQLFIGPYAIDALGTVRVIPYSEMMGRHTGNARHLIDPENKIYVATMEEGFYEVDVHSLKVTELYTDNHKNGNLADLPGAHGKGLYSGQGRLIYANNGEQGEEALHNPFVTSGSLSEWDGAAWRTVIRSQFTEITGPGGIYGNENPETDPIWSIGWDARSLILMLLDHGEWHKYRLPKASHSYDGAHGWNTEWPRIRDIGEENLLMTMHGMFWSFPKTFSATNSAGISPRSTYLKVIGDFCRWTDRIVLGCDDTAQNEFLNKRRAKGEIAAPQSQSNLWFIEPAKLDDLGPVIGRGAVWLNDAVEANRPSDPFLISGFSKRAVHIFTDKKTTLTLEVDTGTGDWQKLDEFDNDGYFWYELQTSADAVWIRIRSSESLQKATAWFHSAGNDERERTPASDKFIGLATPHDTSVSGGLVRAQNDNKRTLHFAAQNENGKIDTYVLNAEMNLTAQNNPEEWQWLQDNAGIPSRDGVLLVDDASVIYIDDDGKRFRLPKNDNFVEPGPLGFGRLCREVATERDLFNCHGTFYELPANNAGGFNRIRPVATHNLRISDYCSYRGLFVMSGIRKDAPDNPHILKSDDGKTALWVGAIDDMWELGKPVGTGGPWKKTAVQANEPSDPYLMTGYDKKSLELQSSSTTTISAEIDMTGMGDWIVFKTFTLSANEPITYDFPTNFQAYWIRFTSDKKTIATAQLTFQ